MDVFVELIKSIRRVESILVSTLITTDHIKATEEDSTFTMKEVMTSNKSNKIIHSLSFTSHNLIQKSVLNIKLPNIVVLLLKENGLTKNLMSKSSVTTWLDCLSIMWETSFMPKLNTFFSWQLKFFPKVERKKWELWFKFSLEN